MGRQVVEPLQPVMFCGEPDTEGSSTRLQAEDKPVLVFALTVICPLLTVGAPQYWVVVVAQPAWFTLAGSDPSEAKYSETEVLQAAITPAHSEILERMV